MNGDIFADINYKEIIKSHIEKKASATIALCKVKDPTRFGVAQINENEQITQFVEKPKKENAPSNLINAGIYVLNPEVLQLIPKGRAVSMEREIFPKLVAEGKLYGYRFQGLWMDVGKPEEYLQANKTLANKLHPNKKTLPKGNFELKKPVALDKGVTIGEKSIIGPNAILGKNVNVGNNVRIKNSVVFTATEIHDSSQIEGAIIGENAIIGKNVRIGKGCIVADHATIKENTHLEKNVMVCPAKEVDEKTLKSKTIR